MPNVKALLERVCPAPYQALRSWRERVALERVFASITKSGDFAVRSGPFQGMLYPRQIVTPERLLKNGVVPKLLGCYEAELHEVVEQALKREYVKIINIGCAEGYYAIGLARRMPMTAVFAFDSDPLARLLCEEMARANAVSERVHVRGECTVEALRTLVSESCLVVCDCEGCERELLDPGLVPGLATCDIVVELHDCVDPRISGTIRQRFARTHDVLQLTKVKRDPGAYPPLKSVTSYQQRLAVTEFRWGPLEWAFLSAKNAGV
jgi:hypothetical protein